MLTDPFPPYDRIDKSHFVVLNSGYTVVNHLLSRIMSGSPTNVVFNQGHYK